MKALIFFCLVGILTILKSYAQPPTKLESVKLNREIAVQKLRIPDNAALRHYFTKAGFKESDEIDATTYKGTDSNGEFQMDVVSKELIRNGKAAIVTTIEFRQAGKVTVLTAAEDAEGNVVQAQSGSPRVLYASNNALPVVNCALSKMSSAAACQTCRTQIRSTILSAQPLGNKVQALFRTLMSSTCGGCAKAGILSIVGCLLS